MNKDGRPKIHGHCSNKMKGGALSSTYRCWNSLRYRCYDETHPNFKHYGGRGIKVCAQWTKFKNFLRDMGAKPEGYTLDRIDVNGHYNRKNCRWVCPCKQSRTQRSTKLSHEKVTEIKWMRHEGFTQKQIGDHFGVRQTTISRVLNGKRWAKPELPVIPPNIV